MQLGRYDLLNNNIYIVADPTPMDVDHATHAGHYIVRPRCFVSEYHDDPPTLSRFV